MLCRPYKVALAYKCVLTSVTVDAIKKSETRNNKHFCLQICPTFSILLFRTEFKFSSLRKLKMDFNIKTKIIDVVEHSIDFSHNISA